jgi:hypothetical protein
MACPGDGSFWAAVRASLATPALALRLVRLPAYSPGSNPAEAIWGLGAGGGGGPDLPGDQGGAAGTDARLLRRAVDPHRRRPVPQPPRTPALAEALPQLSPHAHREVRHVDSIGASV